MDSRCGFRSGRSSVVLTLVVLASITFADGLPAAGLGTSLPPVASGQTNAPTRRLNAPYFARDIRWEEAGIFWFGRADPPGGPGQNYADVRVAYTAEELVIYINAEDYYLWCNEEATPASDLTRYDSVAVYLDTNHDGATAPQSDDYYFLSGLCVYGCGDGSNHRREGRGTGTRWDTEWHAHWNDGTSASWWCNPGRNDNSCIDFGWWSFLYIPWATMGLSGPPLEGTVWGLGVQLYDRDDEPPEGGLPVEHWPEAFEPNLPSTWGELVFGLPEYTPVPAVAQGTAIIRRGLGDSVVEDAWVGGGGTCSGGHEGDPDADNYGGDSDLFVANQSLIADFPCFSKSFLRFHLGAIPPGKTVISATLSLHHWGNANPDNAQPSLIWLFAAGGDWEEYELTWNNAPLARENLTATWVGVCTSDEPCGFPGVRYDWDATQAVAEALAEGQSVNFALYTADLYHDSSKYFSSSDTGDWNAKGRPTLTVVYGEPVGTVDKRVHPVAPSSGEVITYTMVVLGSGHPLTLTDTLPVGLSDPGPIRVTEGSAAYHAASRRVEWSGSPASGRRVTVAFSTTVQVKGPATLVNTATLTDALTGTDGDTAVVIVDGFPIYLPVMLKE